MSKIDPTKIKGPYHLLALLLIVVEAILSLWIHSAESEIERIVSGILMMIIFCLVLKVVIILKEKDVEIKKKYGTISPIKLNLRSPEPKEEFYPSNPSQFRNAKCYYSIFNKGKLIESDIEAQIQLIEFDSIKKKILNVG